MMLSVSKFLGVSTSSLEWSIGTIIALGTGTGLYFLIKSRKQKLCKSLTKGETDNPYESVKLLNEYLSFNYGGKSVNCMFEDISNGFDFPKETAKICLKHYKADPSIPNRALDIGCAVGGAAFELSRQFSEVIGIDYSHGFIKTCNALKLTGRMEYEVNTEGCLSTKHHAIIPEELKRENCSFRQGDACNLPLNLGSFGCVLAANLICRLPSPKDFLLRLSSLVAPGGVCVITSPYTFMEDYCKKENWLGGYVDGLGEEVRAFDTIKKLLLPHFDLVVDFDLPFLIRETARKHQWTASHVTVWKRKVQAR